MPHDAAALPALDPSAADASGPMRVLVVDDNVDALQLGVLLLEMDGLQVRGAGTGAEALATARDFRPEAIVLDLGLPDMDGIEVGRRLRADASLGRPTLIALTGFDQPQDRQRTRDAGFDHHLCKPVEYPQLVDLIRRSRR